MKHADMRAAERYGILHNNEEIIKLIQEGKSTPDPTRRRTKSRCVHVVEYENTKVRVVYSSAKKEIITYLPLNDKKRKRKEKRKKKKALRSNLKERFKKPY
jgi:hypothetical protein